MLVLFCLYQVKFLVNVLLEVVGGIVLGVLVNLYYLFEVEQFFFYGVVEGGVVGDFFFEYFIIGVCMGVDVDEFYWIMFFGQCLQDWQGNGVVFVEGQWDQWIII